MKHEKESSEGAALLALEAEMLHAEHWHEVMDRRWEYGRVPLWAITEGGPFHLSLQLVESFRVVREEVAALENSFAGRPSTVPACRSRNEEAYAKVAEAVDYLVKLVDTGDSIGLEAVADKLDQLYLHAWEDYGPGTLSPRAERGGRSW